MRFVRKPKPYTRGKNPARFPHSGGRVAEFRLPSLGTGRYQAAPENARLPTLPRVLTGLSWLGGAVCVLIAGSALLNQLGREAQFDSVAAHVATLGTGPQTDAAQGTP